MWHRVVLQPLMRSVGIFGKHQRLCLAENEIGLRCFSSPIEERIYTSEQRDIVVDRLNSIRTDEGARKLLGAKLTTNIENHLQKKGNFTKLEEVLQVAAVGPKTIRNVCDKLLGIASSKSNDDSKSSKSSSGRRSRSTVNIVTPHLPEELRESASTLSTIVIDVSSICWAHVDVNKKCIMDWQIFDLPPSSDLLVMKNLIVLVSELQKRLPEADLYLLEDPTPGNINSRSYQHIRSILTCSIATSIHNQREADGKLKLAFVKNRLVEKHFKASVGSETVSLQPFMYDIIGQKVEPGRSNLFVPQQLVNYMKSQEPLLREHLSRAALLAISCIDLILRKHGANDVP